MNTIKLVTASHVCPDYAFDRTAVRIGTWPNEDGTVFYFASHPKLGCGKNATTPERAIYSLFSDHACTVTRIEDQFPSDDAAEPVADAEPVAAPRIVIRSERDRTIYRAFQGKRCLASALLRRPYSDGPLWTISYSDGSHHGTADSQAEMRRELRAAALARWTALVALERSADSMMDAAEPVAAPEPVAERHCPSATPMCAPSDLSTVGAPEPHYHVEKSGQVWTVRRIDQACHIGKVDTRKQALLIARLLAGWNGRVTTGKA